MQEALTQEASMQESTIARPGRVEIESRGVTNQRGGVYLSAGLCLAVLSALWFSGHGALLRFAFPCCAMILAVVLFLAEPVVYVKYSLWMWFLSPLVRRLVDWRFGYLEQNAILLAPLLVAGVAGLWLLRKGAHSLAEIPPGFWLCGGAIVYGFAVGMYLTHSAETVYGLANWLCPWFFGLFVYAHDDASGELRQAVAGTFLWGVLLMGVYGVYQYFVAPAWDADWLTNTQYEAVNPAFGQPEPLLIRVWSTLNSPGPFANVMMAGLLLLFTVRSTWKIPASVAGYISLLLSSVRTAWLSWVVGLLVFAATTRSRAVIRILLLLLVIFGCLLPVLADPRIAPMVSDRFSTFFDLGHDESFAARISMYGSLMGQVAVSPFGVGLSNQTMWRMIPIDSGIISVLFSMGWAGGAAFFAGIASVFSRLSKHRNGVRRSEFTIACMSIVMALATQILGGNIFVGINGMMWWTFAALSIAPAFCSDSIQEADALPGIRTQTLRPSTNTCAT